MSAAPATLVMDDPIEHSLLDDGVQGLIGRDLDRIDGPLKVSGRATYSAEYALDGLVHGFLVRAPFGRGTISEVRSEVAAAMPGVLAVVTDMDTFLRNSGQGGDTDAPEQGVRDVQYFGEPVALVVAESFEAARDAAGQIELVFAAEEGRFDFERHKIEREKPEDGVVEAHWSKGDVDRAVHDAPVTLDVTFTTPSQNSAAMEPHASIATWDADGALTLYGSYQMPASDKQQLADALGLEPDKVRIVARYVGGGFGSKLGIAPESVAAAVAAKQLGRPVKVPMARQQVFDATVRRSNTEQRVQLAAERDGRLTGIAHDTVSTNLDGESFFEPAGTATHFTYAGEHRRVTHDLVRMDWLLSGSMRAPGEAVGMLALEGAMDELAEKLGIDPIELRRINEPHTDPQRDVPFSSRSLQDCLFQGARRFGWHDRAAQPCSRREGEWWIGMGVAAAARSNKLMQSQAKVTIRGDGTASVATDMTDIGTGTYTILAQIAGELLGLPIEAVDVQLGDTKDPAGAGSGGSWGAGSSGSSVYVACAELRRIIADRMGVDATKLTLKDGLAIAENRSVPLGELASAEPLEAVGEVQKGKQDTATRQASYGAHFAEVAVNAVTGETRVRRFLGVFAAGRILNEKTARSQCLGGITFGIGAALSEELIHDTRNGKVVNRDLAEYHVPVNADVPQIEVVFLPERDTHANPLHAKGIGELGISGAGAAIANAVYNACGVRIRDYPLTLDKIISHLPPA